MRNMILSFALLLVFVCLSSGQTGPYSVVIRLGQVIQSQNGHEWAVDVYADVFDANKTLLPESMSLSFYYKWYWNKCLGSGSQPYVEGTGLKHLYPDGHWVKQPQDPNCCQSCPFMSFKLFVLVDTDLGEIESNEVRVPDDSTGSIDPRESVIVEQKRENNVNVGDIGKKWGNALFNYPSPFNFFYVAGETDVFKGSQDLISSPYEKYNQWENVVDVVNHRSFIISHPPPSTVSRFKPVYNSTLQCQLIEGGIPGGTIDFKDPWLIDDTSDPLGPRNRGTGAIYDSVPYQLNNVGVGTIYKGVFLNQDYNIPGNPYYSVGAPSPQTISGFTSYFLNWTGTNVAFQNANLVQTGVVFQQSDATATARLKAHLGSSTSTATAYNSQRKLVKFGGYYHLVYQSAGSHLVYVFHQQRADLESRGKGLSRQRGDTEIQSSDRC